MVEYNNVEVFEFDNFLIKGNTFTMFLRYVCANDVAYCSKMTLLLPLRMACWMRMVSKRVYVRACLKMFLGGITRDVLASLCSSCARVLNSRIDSYVLNMLQKSRLNGSVVVIVSQSLAEVVRRWAVQYDVANVIANEMEFDSDGIFTGRLLQSCCSAKDIKHHLHRRFVSTPNSAE